MAEVIYIISICTRMTEVTGAEEGEYTCRGENVAGEVTSISRYLHISTHNLYTLYLQVTLSARLVVNTLPRVRLVPASSVVLRPGSRLQVILASHWSRTSVVSNTEL